MLASITYLHQDKLKPNDSRSGEQQKQRKAKKEHTQGKARRDDCVCLVQVRRQTTCFKTATDAAWALLDLRANIRANFCGVIGVISCGGKE